MVVSAARRSSPSVASEETLVSSIAAVVRAQPNRPAILFDDEIWSYRELWTRAGAVASGLRHLGLSERSRIALVAGNSGEFIAGYLGILRAGYTVVPVNVFLRPDELQAQIEFADVAYCVVGAIEDDSRELLAERFSAADVDSLHDSSVEMLPSVRPTAPAALIPTSGSTGAPKGVVLSHRAMLHAALQLIDAFPFSQDDVTLALLPLFASVYEQVLPTLMSGGAVDVLRRFDPEAVARACGRATTFDAVPTAIARLLDAAPHGELNKLRWIMFASEPMPPARLEHWWTSVPDVETYEFYGMNEALTITRATDAELREEPRCVGVPFATSTVTIRDEDGMPLPPGKEGEIVCTTPTRMDGYFRDPDETEAAFTSDDGMRTGDLGRIDDEGRLHLTGRLKDVILSGGFTISPAELEAVACRHPAVASASVVGVPDDRFGETPAVLAVPYAGATVSATEVLAHCRSSVSSFKRPSAAAIVDSLPVTGIGKLAKRPLREAIERGEIELEHAH